MATVEASGPGSALGTSLQSLLLADDIAPGASPGYQLCKTIYLYHPLGAKIVEKPLEIAQSQKRDIAVPDSPGERIVEAFNEEWIRIGADGHIFNVAAQARIYGISSIAIMQKDVDVSTAVDWDAIWDQKISFNVFDPLNTAGSLVLSQDPMSPEFQHTTEIRVQGNVFHRSRTCVVMNEKPIYIDFTPSAFGFVGRSVYQRSLFPLKSFIQTMMADDFVAGKVGSMVAKIKQPSSVIDNAMIKLFGLKRAMVKELKNFGVISVSPDEDVTSLDLTSIEGPLDRCRRDIVENIASATPMPAKLLTEESFAEGFGEGTEDAKSVARFIDKVRESMAPLYDFFDQMVMHRAWNPDFYRTIQAKFPEYKDVPYKTAFNRWRNSFTAQWPNLLKEPDSELVQVDEVKLRSVMAMLQILEPILKGTGNAENKAELVKWAIDNFNSMKLLFSDPLVLDYDEVENGFATEPTPEEAGAGGEDRRESPPAPFAAIDELRSSVDKLVQMRKARGEATRKRLKLVGSS
jgi:hypothetical protein